MSRITAWIVVILTASFLKSSRAAIATELPQLSNDSITCYPDPEFFVSHEFLSNAGITAVDKVILVNDIEQTSAADECTAVESPTGYTFLLNNTFGDCAANISIVDSAVRKVTYYILVVPQSSGVISREGCVFIRVCCFYETLIEGIFSPLHPRPKIHNTHVAPATREYVAEGSFYSDSGLSTSFPNGRVNVNDDVYVAIWLTETDASPDIQMETCFATQTSDPDVLPRYYLIEGGCPSDQTSIISSGFSKHFYFKFPAFHWLRVIPDNQHIYIQCEMKVCGEKLGTTCLAPTCNLGKKKRAITEDENDQNTQLVTVGPLLVTGADDVNNHVVFELEPVKCDKIAAGCSHECVFNLAGGTTCVCPRHEILHTDGKTCIPEIPVAHKQQDMLSHLPFIAVITFGVTCILLLLVKIHNHI